MENNITWDKLINSTKDPFSSEVAEEFVKCILTKDTSRKIILDTDIFPKDNEEYDIEKGLNEGKTKLVRFILYRIKKSIVDIEIGQDVSPKLLASKGFNVEKSRRHGKD